MEDPIMLRLLFYPVQFLFRRNVTISRPSSDGAAYCRTDQRLYLFYAFRQNGKISFSRLFVSPKRQP